MKYRSNIISNPIYCERGIETVRERIISALFQMHSQGKDFCSARVCLLDNECDGICQTMQSIQATNTLNRMIIDASSALQMYFPKISMIAEYVRSGHPSILETTAAVYCPVNDDTLHRDFPSLTSWVTAGDRFLRSPLGLVIAVQHDTEMIVRGVYKTGKYKDPRRFRLLKGDGLLYRGDLFYRVEGCAWFVQLSFGTKDFHV